MKTVLYFQSSLAISNMRELDGVRRYAETADWNLEVVEYDGAAKSRFQTAGGAVTGVKGMLSFWRPAGCIVECGGRPPRFSRADFGRTPCVFLDCHPCDAGRGALCVWQDEEVVGSAIARELLSLGFDDYAYIPWPEARLSWNRVRCEAFEKRVLEAGSRVHAFVHSSSTMDKVRLLREISGWVRELPRPCGVLAANDSIASIFVDAASAAGFGVPRDFAVAGVDNDTLLCESGSVTLTSVETSSMKAGVSAAELLAGRMEGGRDRTCVVVKDFHLHRRASTRIYKNADARVVKALEFIRKRACGGIAPPDVVAEMGCSRRLADMRFREATGHTILDEIHAVRIERVKEFLRKGGVTTSFIADSTGYSSVVDLRRVFKRITGTTMRMYPPRGPRA